MQGDLVLDGVQALDHFVVERARRSPADGPGGSDDGAREGVFVFFERLAFACGFEINEEISVFGF